MKKQKLNGAFGEVLELYDGQMALPNKKLISDNVPQLKFSSHGKELFALSESLYGKWLKEGEDLGLVDGAVELCREAVDEGYPHAVIKMAYYYDKDYLATDRTEEFRCRVACDYYCKVIYCDEVPKNTDGVIPELNWEELKKLAARMCLDMLAAAPPSLSEYGSGKYSYEYHRDRIAASLGIVSDLNYAVQRTERDGEKFALSVFEGCKNNKFRAPLFGVFALNREEAKSVFAPKSAVMKLCGDINVWLYNGDSVLKVNNTSAFNAFLNGLEREKAWVFFFNNNLGGHRYLSGKQRKELCELMLKDGHHRFFKLKTGAEELCRSEYLFSDDDVQFFINGRLTPLKSALDGLINKVLTDGEWSEQ